jgi:hypothetical protein
MTDRELLIKLANETKEQAEQAKRFIELSDDHKRYWIGIKEQALLTLKALQEMGINPNV